MYAWLFRHLPGPLWIRIIQTLLLLAFVVLALMNFVFPWANQFSPWNDSTVDALPARPETFTDMSPAA